MTIKILLNKKCREKSTQDLRQRNYNKYSYPNIRLAVHVQVYISNN